MRIIEAWEARLINQSSLRRILMHAVRGKIRFAVAKHHGEWAKEMSLRIREILMKLNENLNRKKPPDWVKKFVEKANAIEADHEESEAEGNKAEDAEGGEDDEENEEDEKDEEDGDEDAKNDDDDTEMIDGDDDSENGDGAQDCDDIGRRKGKTGARIGKPMTTQKGAASRSPSRRPRERTSARPSTRTPSARRLHVRRRSGRRHRRQHRQQHRRRHRHRRHRQHQRANRRRRHHVIRRQHRQHQTGRRGTVPDGTSSIATSITSSATTRSWGWHTDRSRTRRRATIQNYAHIWKFPWTAWTAT